MQTLSRLIRNALHFLISNLLSFGMGLIVSVVMARKLGPNDLGIFHQAQWFAGLISTCLSLGFITSITKFTAQYRAEGRHADLAAAMRHIFRLEGFIGAISSIGLLLAATPIADHYFSPQESLLFRLTFLAITPGLQTAVLSASLEGAQIFRYQSVHALSVTPLALITKVVVLSKGGGLVSLFVINLAFALINLAFFSWAVHREGLMRPNRANEISAPKGNWKQELFKYNRSMIGIHFVDLIVWSRSENYFLGRFCKASEIAYYNLAQNLLLRFTGILPNLMWKLLLPLSSQHHGRMEIEKMKRTYHLALRYASILIFPTLTACYLASYELIVIFYGHAYAEAKTCFQILCLGSLLTSLAQPGSAAIYATNRHTFILRYGALLAVLNIGLNFWWIPKFGSVGAAVSYAITTALGAIGGFVYTWRTLGFLPPWQAFLRQALACVIMAGVLIACLHLPTEPFNYFEGIRQWLKAHFHHAAEMFLGARTQRLCFGLFLSSVTYLGGLYIFSKPEKEDLLVLQSLQRYLPRQVSHFCEILLNMRMRKDPEILSPRATL